ncbi:Synaptosomal-associated protein 29 [Halotydeus destructor]|nr:Synaptosomal-associated protein 29 [Halotydeus destructor]
MNSRAISGRNPYLEDDDVDDLAFVSHPPQGSGGYMLGNKAAVNNDYAQKRQQLLEERQKIEERTLQSSRAALSLVYDSEKIGIATAEELTRQREKLDNIDTNLDSMNSTMRNTQKHLTSMKSWFGGIFSKSDAASKPGPGINTRPVSFSSNLSQTVETLAKDPNRRSSEAVPQSRGIQPGFTFDDEKPQRSNNHVQTSRDIDQQLSSNLGELDLGIGRLKSLALGLGQEIDDQSQLIDGITAKAERGEDTLQYQNRQMRQILKK